MSAATSRSSCTERPFYLFGDRHDARAALVTSANLTAAGMWDNLELGLVHYDPEVSKRAIRWFDELWEQATPYKDDLYDFLFPDVGLLDPLRNLPWGIGAAFR